MKIALTGGIACGKSTFAKFLVELGIRVLDADDVVHDLEAPHGLAVPSIVSAFGPSVLAPDGSIDRTRLAQLVFPSKGSVPTHPGSVPTRQQLEDILFPPVRARLLAFVEDSPSPWGCPQTPGVCPQVSRVCPQVSRVCPQVSRVCPQTAGVCPSAPGTKHQAPGTSFRIAIIPLLFESHFDTDYDTIIALVSTKDVQIERMMRTRGYSRAQAEARIASQMPVAEKAARADFVVINDSTPAHLKDEARRLVDWLKERAKYEERRTGDNW